MAIRQTKALAVIALFATPLLTACGGGDSKLKTALSDAVYASGQASGAPFEVSRKSSGCVADTLLKDKSTAKDLEKAYEDGKDGKDLLDAVGDAELSTTAIINCTPKDELIPLLVDEFTSGAQNTKKAINCLDDKLNDFSEDSIHKLLLAFLNNDTSSDEFADLTAAILKCKVSTDSGSDNGDGTSDEQLKTIITNALLEENKNSGDSPIVFDDSEVGCMADQLLSDSNLKGLFSDAIDSGKSGEALLDAVDTGGNARTPAAINCLSRYKLIMSFMAILRDQGADDQKLDCLWSEFDATMSASDMRQLMNDVLNDVSTSEASQKATAAMATCGLA